MTEPRQILKDSVYLVTRRCSQRQFLLLPDSGPNDEVAQIFEYCLAHAAEKAGIKLIAYLVMSNHWHGIVEDPDGRLPEFTAELHRLVAKCMNKKRNRFEGFWSPEHYSAVRLETPEAILSEIRYVLTNPVAAALVPSFTQWPGAFSHPNRIGRGTKRIARPEVYFPDDSIMDGHKDLELHLPSVFAHDGYHSFRAQVTSLVREREKELVDEISAKGRSFLGRRVVLAQKPTDSPVGKDSEHFGLSPQLAAVDKWRLVEAKQRLASFREAYRECWLRFKRRELDVEWPLGTYWMVKHARMWCVGEELFCPG